MQGTGVVSSRSRVTIALVIFALLAFTTIRTSPLSAGLGSGSALSKTTPKQRHLSAQEIAWTFPVLRILSPAPLDFCNVVPSELNDLSFDHFSGRYFNLPPPTA